MSTTTPGFTLSPRAEAVAYFIGLFLVYLATYAPTISSASPSVVRSFFAVLGVAVIIIKYELSQNVPTTIPTSLTALLTTIALILTVAGGYISANYGAYWYGGFIVALIGSFLAAYTAIGGQIPTPSTASVTP